MHTEILSLSPLPFLPLASDHYLFITISLCLNIISPRKNTTVKDDVSKDISWHDSLCPKTAHCLKGGYWKDFAQASFLSPIIYGRDLVSSKWSCLQFLAWLMTPFPAPVSHIVSIWTLVDDLSTDHTWKPCMPLAVFSKNVNLFPTETPKSTDELWIHQIYE